MEADPHKLEAYNVTVPQILTALGNSNINVGGREIAIGQQSINIRGVGLIDDGGSDDLTQGYKVGDIENVVLSQNDGVPVLVKDVANVSVSYRPRLGILGRDHEDDVVGGDRGAEENGKDRRDDSQGRSGHQQPEPRRKPAAGRQSGSVSMTGRHLIAVTTHTVLHNLIFGFILVFLIQWIFLGESPQRHHRRH